MSEDSTETKMSDSVPSPAEVEAASLRAELFAVRSWYLCRFQTLLPLLAEAEEHPEDSELCTLIDGVLAEAIGESTFMEEV